MKDNEIIDRLKIIVAKKLLIKKDEVSTDSHIVNNLGTGSLIIVEIIMEVEEEFDIEISDDEIESLKTIYDLFVLVKASITTF